VKLHHNHKLCGYLLYPYRHLLLFIFKVQYWQHTSVLGLKQHTSWRLLLCLLQALFVYQSFSIQKQSRAKQQQKT